MTFGALARPQAGAIRRHPMLALLIVALLALLVLALPWHLVSMAHDYPGGMLGGCIVVLAIGLVVVAAHLRAFAADVDAAIAIPTPSGSASPDCRPRPPPERDSIQATVLLL